MLSPLSRRSAAAACAAALALPLGGCGGSDQPDYCAKRQALTKDVKALGDVKFEAGAVASLKAQAQKVATDAQALIDAARTDFPTQTSAMQRALDALRTSADAAASAPSAATLATVASNVSQLAASVTAFADAASGSC